VKPHWYPYQLPPDNKVIEIRKQIVKPPFTVIEVGDKAALLQLRKQMAEKELLFQARQTERYEKAKADVERWIQEQNAPEDVRRCECGAHSLNSECHSSWCPIFELSFTRHKYSQKNY